MEEVGLQFLKDDIIAAKSTVPRADMKTSIVIITFAFAALVVTSAAEMAAFVEMPEGFIIGAHSDGKWLTSENAGKALKRGSQYRLFSLSGEIGKATGGKVEPNPDVCPDVWTQKLTPELEQSAIAVSASWNPQPRIARKADTTQEAYVNAAREFIESQGIRKPVVKITQLLRVDIDGDGEDEVLLSATHYPKRDGGMGTSASAGNYSFVLLRRVVNGNVQTQLIEGEFYPAAKVFNAPNRYGVSGLLDLDGDGKLEVIVESQYYEGGATSVWRMGKAKIEKVLEIACGA